MQALRHGTSCLTVWILAVLAGCSHVDYQAHRLPLDMQATVGARQTPLDLSQLARRAYQSDRIYHGDTLELTIASGLEQQPPRPMPVRVDEDGTVKLPLVGSVPLAGLTLTEAEQVIRQTSVTRQIYREPHVSLALQQRQTVAVRVVGAVQKPGVYEVPAIGGDLLAALVAAGGLAEEAGQMVDIRHPSPASPGASGAGNVTSAFVEPASDGQAVQPASYSAGSPRYVRVNLHQLGPRSDADLHVEDGSVVMVHTRPTQRVHVMGLVRKPDAYEIPEDGRLRVLDAIALAGGTTLSMANKVHVIRQLPQREKPVVIGLSLSQAKYDGRSNLLLQAGDVVSVEETPTTFVVDTVRSFIRFGFSSTVPGL